MRTVYVGDRLDTADGRTYLIYGHAPDGNMMGVCGRDGKLRGTRLFTPDGQTVQAGIDKAVIKHHI